MISKYSFGMRELRKKNNNFSKRGILRLTKPKSCTFYQRSINVLSTLENCKTDLIKANKIYVGEKNIFLIEIKQLIVVGTVVASEISPVPKSIENKIIKLRLFSNKLTLILGIVYCFLWNSKKIFYKYNDGTIIWTGTTWKEIPCPLFYPGLNLQVAIE